ncbi:MAG TPA: glutamate cyclase domain-containing protein [Candidatus Dormibacteraeota bacterium]
MPSIIEYMDRLITVEMRNPAMPHSMIAPLYEAARREGGGDPLTYRAAHGLIQHVRPKDVVLINTGAGSGELIPNGENDGPVGAAALARAVERGLHATPVFVCETHHAGPIAASSEAAGVGIRSLDVAMRHHVGGAVVTHPDDPGKVAEWSEKLLDELKPKAIIATERLGPNAKGVIHGSTGIATKPITDSSPLFAAAAKRGIFSIGIGDAGNEIGFGRIYDEVRKIQDPWGHTCQCPCQDGMATVVPTDVLIAASVSNWGCYGIEAALGVLLKRPDLVHSPEQEERIQLRCVEAGGIEALFCTQNFECDGISGETHMSIVRMLGEMVRIYLGEHTTGPIH